MSTAILCKNCQRMPAFFLRPYSGEYLCKHCLRRGVLKQIRKTLSYYPIVKRGEEVLYLIRLDRPAESIVFMDIFKYFIKRLNLKVHIFIPEELKSAIDTVLINMYGDNVFATVNYVPVMEFKPTCFAELVKVHEVLALALSRELGCTTVLSPIFREELVFLALLGLTYASRSIFGDAFPVKQLGSSRVSRPTYLVSLFDIVALTYSNRRILQLFDEANTSTFFNPVELSLLKTLYEVTRFSKELIYASRKSIELIQSMFIPHQSRCKLCLSFTDQGDVCEICNRLF